MNFNFRKLSNDICVNGKIVESTKIIRLMS